MMMQQGSIRAGAATIEVRNGGGGGSKEVYKSGLHSPGKPGNLALKNYMDGKIMEFQKRDISWNNHGILIQLSAFKFCRI